MRINFGDIPDPAGRYEFGDLIGCGVYGKVYLAFDTKASNKKVAIKLQKYEGDTRDYVEEEYKILRDLSNHINIVDFYGIYRRSNEIWFVMEPCEGGAVIDLVNRLLSKNRRLSEEHIAYLLKETVKALIHLHHNKVVHRDVKGSNILLTREGEVKLCDFGLSKKIKNKAGKCSAECVGSLSWIAPELIAANQKTEDAKYDSRVDIWSFGITAIELGDGKAPFQDMHPSRALFQIVRNPPPTLNKVSNWSPMYHDLISECLVKDYKYRPYIMEIIEHPFLQRTPENNYHLSLEIKSLLNDITISDPLERYSETCINGKLLKKHIDEAPKPIYEEDLAALESVTESEILNLLERRMALGECYNFIGDILLFLNPNKTQNIYGCTVQQKYKTKSRSENAPHIYAIADTAYQNAIHHVMSQQILLSGETCSGKTTNYMHLIDHLFYIGENSNINSSRIKNTVHLIHSLIHASTPSNNNSTRAVFKTRVSYGKTGKLTAANFKVHCLEKWRVSSMDMTQSTFHIIFYLYDGIVSSKSHEKYLLNSNREYRYLRDLASVKQIAPRNSIENYNKIVNCLAALEFSDSQISTIFSVIAAILNIGEINFGESYDYSALLENKEIVHNVSQLLEVENKKLCWALTNYCMIRGKDVIRKRNSCKEARNTRDVLANNLYARLVDYIIGIINHKLSLGQAIYGDKFSIKIWDYFGFECFKRNNFSQLIVNCLNEQFQYHFLQRVFAWEMLDAESERIPFIPIVYYNNKDTLNELLEKPEGILSIIDDASIKRQNGRYITENINYNEKHKIMTCGEAEFTVIHYTGKVTYNCNKMPEKNRDYLPPEIIETMRNSQNAIISMLFTNKLCNTGEIIIPCGEARKSKNSFRSKEYRNRQYSQIKNMRTQATIFRSLCLDISKELSIGSGTGGTHFIRCIRTNLKGMTQDFQRELVRQQIRALAVVQSAKARQHGYPQRISFQECLRRYKFLAFDFDENVELTKENCRLLMIRLKMEGWALGNTKVFLKYYNEELLSRLYETHVRKIIKVQSVLRRFLVKCRIEKEIKEQKTEFIEEIQKRRRSSEMTEEEAAALIQKAYRKSTRRKEILQEYESLEEEDFNFVRPYAMTWKKRSIFSVLMRYRGMTLQEFFNLSQQVHLYNLNTFHNLYQLQNDVDAEEIDKNAITHNWLGKMTPTVLKVHFHLADIPFYDTSSMCDLFTNIRHFVDEEESWDKPYKWRQLQAGTMGHSFNEGTTVSSDILTNSAYSRDPNEPILALASPELDNEQTKEIKESINKEEKERKMIKPTEAELIEIIENNQEKCKTKVKIEPSNNNNNTNKEAAFQKIKLRKIEDSYRSKLERENFIINSSPANKDFDYIKAKPVTVKPKYSVDPIAELKSILRSKNTNEDDPPFNFQGMLRKTNFRRESLKTTVEPVRRFSLGVESDVENTINNYKYEAGPILSKLISQEIVPGLFLEGLEIDL